MNDHSHGEGTKWAHLTLCIGPDGVVDFYPEGDPEAIVKALKTTSRLFRKNPELIRHVAGACHGLKPPPMWM